MRASLYPASPILPLAALLFASCGPHVRVVSVSAVEVHASVADLSLRLFWNLASLQLRDPSVSPLLLNADPQNPSETLGPLEVGFEEYRQQLAEVSGMRPIILFLPHGANLVEEARRRGLAISPWPREAPPALLSGPELDTLILFQPLAGARNEPSRAGMVAFASTASAKGLTRFALAQSQPADPIRLYRVRPGEWSASATFAHVRCGNPAPEMEMITKLTYREGFVDSQTTTLTEESWEQCALSPAPGLRSATVKQLGRDQAGQPVVIASSQFLDPYPGILLAEWIRVR